jgi:hypothetical protein
MYMKGIDKMSKQKFLIFLRGKIIDRAFERQKNIVRPKARVILVTVTVITIIITKTITET